MDPQIGENRNGQHKCSRQAQNKQNSLHARRQSRGHPLKQRVCPYSTPELYQTNTLELHNSTDPVSSPPQQEPTHHKYGPKSRPSSGNRLQRTTSLGRSTQKLPKERLQMPLPDQSKRKIPHDHPHLFKERDTPCSGSSSKGGFFTSMRKRLA